MYPEPIYREFTITMTDKSSGKFLRAIAQCGATIKSSYCVGSNLPNYRYASMDFCLAFKSAKDVDLFHSLGFVTREHGPMRLN